MSMGPPLTGLSAAVPWSMPQVCPNRPSWPGRQGAIAWCSAWPRRERRYLWRGRSSRHRGMRGCPIPGEGAELLLLVRLPGWEWSDVPVDVPVPGLAAQAQDVEPLGGSFSVSLPRFLLRAARRVAGGAAARPGGSGVHRATGRPLREQKSSPGSSSRQPSRRDSPTGCGSITFVTPARVCSSRRARASRRSRPSSAMLRRR